LATMATDLSRFYLTLRHSYISMARLKQGRGEK